jgi:outer membrane murein-binding lipoprotein Lpp
MFTRLNRTDKVQKRASNVLKLSQEHEKLKEELRAMTERLEAAERKQKEFMTRRKGTRGGNPN